jgi:3-oxoacyl-[acyl-carrier-protein] synthase II
MSERKRYVHESGVAGGGARHGWALQLVRRAVFRKDRGSMAVQDTPMRPTGLAPDRRVVVTGAGVITSMGEGWRANADGFRDGRLAFREVTLFDTTRQRVSRAGEVALPDGLPATPRPVPERRRLDRATRLLLSAATEAWDQAGWQAGLDAEARGRLALVLGTSAGAMALGEAYFRQSLTDPSARAGQVRRVNDYQMQRQGVQVAAALGAGGPVTVISNACASGANAIGHAFQLVRAGRACQVLAGGYDALCQLVFAGFDSLQALSTDVPRPFDARRDGLALGEGAGVLALESLASAQARGAVVLAEVTGYGTATDLHHLTQPHPEGEAALRSMERACAQAGVGPDGIDYVNSHGTGTLLNDVAEAHAIRRWCERAGSDPARLAVSSTKGGIGHLLGGAGAVEAVICVLAMRESFVPPSVSVRDPDPAVVFDLVRAPRAAGVGRALTNSFGFGGSNATLILERWN